MSIKTFKTTRYIPVIKEHVFDAFAAPSKLEKWWGPEDSSNTFNYFDFQVGGKWSFVMHGPNGVNYPNESEFVEIVPNEKIVIRHHSLPHFTLTVLLSVYDNGTNVNWIQEFDDEEVARKAAAIVIPANEQNLDRLTNVVLNH